MLLLIFLFFVMVMSIVSVIIVTARLNGIKRKHTFGDQRNAVFALLLLQEPTEHNTSNKSYGKLGILNAFYALTNFWFELLGLSGIVIFSLPSATSGQTICVITWFLDLPTKATISALVLGTVKIQV